ncbi:MAG: PQQ-binding-like beta-propeller repeat protein, partial [Gemmatimonadota bacterium]|nr:PQQ-binding-like beta-propeller repeat protein [Gemmatimonadota bacterium]
MWRCDAGRTAVSEENLPDELHLLWERRYSPRVQVWDDPLNHDLMPYDKVFEPVVWGKRMFIGFNDCDKVVALDTESGREEWAFYTDGPVRFPPVAWEGKVYFTSDDGNLYCVDAGTGRLVWKFRGGPGERKVLGNKRLISAWPARGGAVIDDGTVYFAASIWPFMGTFIHALDAGTGQVIWTNDRTGSDYILQPHSSPSFAGVAPQGALAVSGSRLLVPGGRSVPACFDRHSGQQLFFHLAWNKAGGGGSFVSAGGGVFFNHFRDQFFEMYDLETGASLIHRIGQYPVLTEETFYISGQIVRAFDAGEIHRTSRRWVSARFWADELSRALRASLGPAPRFTDDFSCVDIKDIEELHEDWVRKKSRQWMESLRWEIEVDGRYDLIKAGGGLYAAGEQGITALKLTEEGEGGTSKIAWTSPVKGSVRRLLAADGKLFAVTLDGRIMAFGSEKAQPVRIDRRVARQGKKPPAAAGREARKILRSTGVREGYALCYGVDSALLEALAANSDLKIIAVDRDSAYVENLRRRLDAAGLYGSRIAVHCGGPLSFQAPQYLASLTVVDCSGTAGAGCEEELLKRIFNSMRPYGGKSWFLLPEGARDGFIGAAGALKGSGLDVTFDDGSMLLTREGSLSGAASWTHQYGNIANTAKSDDTLVRLPLGMLWFGGNSNLDVLPRHAHGPPEQVIGGRLFIEGMDCLSARDVYTGRVLWKVTIEGLNNLGVYFDGSYKDTPTSTEYNQLHIPGANIRGTNYIATAEKVYILAGGACRVLDAKTGKTVRVITIPAGIGSEKPEWSYIGVYEDYLIGGSGFAVNSSLLPRDEKLEQELAKLSPTRRKGRLSFYDFDKSASRSLWVIDRHSGRKLWNIEAAYGFPHNAIAVGGGKIFCLDKLPPYIENRMKRRGGGAPGEKCRLMALDIDTGKILWKSNDREKIFGSWLGYSREHDVLLQSTRPSRDMVRGETGERMAVFRGSDGSLLWDREQRYSSVPIIHGERIITQGKVVNLLTGEPGYRRHPLTGEQVPATWRRNYGCNYPIASENLLTFRSAAAGFYDLTNNGGTGNLGGFKSGCTSNLVAADGVLNAPDYTRTCSCSYQNQTSLALVHMPEVETWTFSTLERGTGAVKRVGINFGAPGDRMAGNGTLWLDYPSRGGSSPDVPVIVEAENPQWFCRHSSRVEAGELRWVAASGVRGISSLTV